MIEAVGVIVPAHDEASRIERCVGSVLGALRTARPRAVRLCVLADRCRDATVRQALAAARRAAIEQAARGEAVIPVDVLDDHVGGTVGAVRNRAVAVVLAASGAPVDRTWLLSTDADGAVAPDWVDTHLTLADSGADAVVGGVLLDRAGGPVPPDEPDDPDPPVYGANLGVRADAFLAVGGFPDRACGEDHGLIDRLRRAGHPIVRGAPATVYTSSRTRGRARGGLADLLHTRAAAVRPVGTRERRVVDTG